MSLVIAGGQGLYKSSPGSTDCTYLSACGWVKVNDPPVTGGTYTGPFYIYDGNQYRVLGYSGTGLTDYGLFGAGGTTYNACDFGFSPTPSAGVWMAFAVRITGSGANAITVRWYDSSLALQDEETYGIDNAYSAPTILYMYGLSGIKGISGKMGRSRMWASSNSGAALSFSTLEDELASNMLLNPTYNILDFDAKSLSSIAGWTYAYTSLDAVDDPPYLGGRYKTKVINATIDNAAGLNRTVILLRDE